jgi:hypothetical protein
MAEKELICPNCGPGTKTHAGAGDKIVCEQCGGSFVFVAGEAKLKQMGELDQIKTTLADHEAAIKGLQGQPPVPPRPDDPEDGEDEELSEDEDDEDL